MNFNTVGDVTQISYNTINSYNFKSVQQDYNDLETFITNVTNKVKPQTGYIGTHSIQALDTNEEIGDKSSLISDAFEKIEQFQKLCTDCQKYENLTKNESKELSEMVYQSKLFYSKLQKQSEEQSKMQVQRVQGDRVTNIFLDMLKNGQIK